MRKTIYLSIRAATALAELMESKGWTASRVIQTALLRFWRESK